MPSSYTLTAKKWSMVSTVCDCIFTPGSLGQIFNIPPLDPIASNRLASDNFRLQVLCLLWQRVPTRCWATWTSWWQRDPNSEPLQTRKDSVGLMLMTTSSFITPMFFQKQTTSEWNVPAEQQHCSKRKHRTIIKHTPDCGGDWQQRGAKQLLHSSWAEYLLSLKFLFHEHTVCH